MKRQEMLDYIEKFEGLANDMKKLLENYEEKEETMSWYTVFYVDGALHIDQRLDAQTEADARDMVKNKYLECDYRQLLAFEAETGEIPKAIYNSYPF